MFRLATTATLLSMLAMCSFLASPSVVQGFSVVVVYPCSVVKRNCALNMFRKEEQQQQDTEKKDASASFSFGKPLASMDDSSNKEQAMTNEDGASSSSSSSTMKSVVRDMNTGEIKEVAWVDPAMSANTNPFNLGWAYFFVIFPAMLLLNDAFHFIDPNGPLGFLARF